MELKRRSFWYFLVLVVLAGGLAAFMRRDVEPAARSFLTDEYGRAIVAHGFNTANSAKSSEDGLPEFTEDDLKREHADMGTNFVRFLISWRAVEPKPGVYNTAYLDAVAQRIAWYESRGYTVMLDMHQDLWGIGIQSQGNQVGNGAPEWATHTDGKAINNHDMWELYYLDPGVIRAFDHFWGTTGKHPELAEHYAKAWQAVAKHFADNETVVAYDLMNEPYGGSIQGPAFEAGALTDLYQETTNAIRSVDQKTWICVEPQAIGYNWGAPSGLGFIDDPRNGDPRIAFCPHIYPLPMDLGGGYEGDNKKLVDATIEAWQNNTLRTAQRLGDVPIILGEYGLDTTKPGALDYVEKVLSVTGEMGAGAVYWSRDDGSWGPYESDGSERNLVSVYDRIYPRAIAGTPHSWRTDGDRLEITMTPNPKIVAKTEIQLPRIGFENGVNVSGGSLVSWDQKRRIALIGVAGKSKTTVVISPK